MTAPDRRRASTGWEDLARGAAGRDGAAPQIELLHLISFALDGALYAVRVEAVREIVRMRPITPIPRVPEAVRGVISLRGEIVQIVDLRRRLGLPAAEPTRASRILVVHGADGLVAGLLVDAVREVLRIDADAILPPSGDAIAVDAMCACGDEFVSLIALQRVLEIDAEI